MQFKTQHHDYVKQWEKGRQHGQERGDTHQQQLLSIPSNLAWYHATTWCKLSQWTQDDYVDFESLDKENMSYNQSTHLGT